MAAPWAALLLAFANTPGGHAPRPEPRVRQLERAFFVDAKVRLTSDAHLDLFARETATPLYDPPTGRLYVGTRDGALRCFVRGRPAWTHQAASGVLATPLMAADTLYVPTGGGALVALNRITGQTRWSTDLKEELTTTPTLAEGRLFVASSEEAVTALDAATGKSLWKFRREPGAGFLVRGNARPRHAHGLIYTGFADGSVVALTPSSGVAKWVRAAGGAGDYLDIDALEAPEEDARLYAAGARTGVVALDAKTGEPVWTYALPGANRLLIEGARIYAGGRGAVVALSRIDGKKLWQFALGADKFATAPATADGLLLFAVERGPLYALDADTGRARGIFDPGSGFSQGVLPMKGAAMIVSNSGSLFTLGLLP